MKIFKRSSIIWTSKSTKLGVRLSKWSRFLKMRILRETMKSSTALKVSWIDVTVKQMAKRRRSSMKTSLCRVRRRSLLVRSTKLSTSSTKTTSWLKTQTKRNLLRMTSLNCLEKTKTSKTTVPVLRPKYQKLKTRLKISKRGLTPWLTQ